MDNNTFILLVGRSGSGKNCVAQGLRNLFGYREVKSYTTRAKRFPGEDTHIFVNKKDYKGPPEDTVAWTEFDGNAYWATNQQIEDNDIYVIDIDGVEYFFENYKGNKKIVICYIECEPGECFQRMLDRGDTIDMALARMRNDEFHFNKEKVKAFCNKYEVHSFYNGKGARLPGVVDAIDRLACSQEIHSA